MAIEKRRSGAQDIAKGIMVIAVVFFHAYVLSFTNRADSLTTFNVLIMLFPFLMISFFFYTGYNYADNGRTFKQNIARRAKQLLIPLVAAFIISAIVVSTMEFAFNHDDPGATFHAIGNSILYILMSDPLARMIGFPQAGGIIYEVALALGLVWFLYALFICSVFFYLLVRFTNKSLPTLISVDIGLLVLTFCIGQFVGTYLPYTVQCYPVILATMLTAAHLRQHNFLDKEITCKKDAAIVGVNALIAEGLIVGTCLACFYLFGSTTPGTLAAGRLDATLKGFDAFVVFAFGIVGTYFIHSLCRLILKIPVVGMSLAWVGKHSAIFYLFHPIFLDLTLIVFFQKQNPWGRAQALLTGAVAVAMLTLVCLLIDWIAKIRKNKKAAAAASAEQAQAEN